MAEIRTILNQANDSIPAISALSTSVNRLLSSDINLSSIGFDQEVSSSYRIHCRLL